MKPGTIKLHEGQFLVECAPHVAIKLRRVFGGVQRHGAGRFVLSATPAIAHELAWFRERHPLELVLVGAADDHIRKLAEDVLRRSTTRGVLAETTEAA